MGDGQAAERPRPAADRVFEHNPDTGCAACQLCDGKRCYGDVDPDGAPGRHITSDLLRLYDPAPEWCPLRQGRVVVQAPAREAPER